MQSDNVLQMTDSIREITHPSLFKKDSNVIALYENSTRLCQKGIYLHYRIKYMYEINTKVIAPWWPAQEGK
jgi:hypothetical protein